MMTTLHNDNDRRLAQEPGFNHYVPAPSTQQPAPAAVCIVCSGLRNNSRFKQRARNISPMIKDGVTSLLAATTPL
ncbi:unnamed protein product [Danaus chrysippus]|uniref:(African queen) hypothetical protein n=1 Tax=Danaus chrysippus TaxID=151541 RepID=A0A8J2R6I0_9NEOP|nr:unnamed protein product [Danaus chrysippus]